MAAWLFSTGTSHHSLPPHIPWIRLSTVNSSPCAGIAPQSLNSNSRVPCLPGDLHPYLGYVWLRQRLFSFHTDCQRTAVSLSALNLSPPTQTVALMWGSDHCFSSPTRWRQVQSYWHPCFSPLFLCPSKFSVVLCVIFRWSGSSCCSQLVFCMHFCVWKCIPDVSVEGDVLHVHLLLCHLVLLYVNFLMMAMWLVWGDASFSDN